MGSSSRFPRIKNTLKVPTCHVHCIAPSASCLNSASINPDDTVQTMRHDSANDTTRHGYIMMVALFAEYWKLIAGLLIAAMFVVGNPKLLAAIKNAISPDSPYERRKDFFSAAELNFDQVLRLAVKDKYRIMGKVRVADLLQVRRGVAKKDRPSAQNKINGKHIDFVLIDPKSCQVACCIELDDKSHERKERVSRDVFLNNAFDAAKLPLLRIPCKRTYQPEQLFKLITRAAKMSNAEIRKMMESENAAAPPTNSKATPKPELKPKIEPKLDQSEPALLSDQPVTDLPVEPIEPKTDDVVEGTETENSEASDAEKEKEEAVKLEKFTKYLETYNKT